MSSADYDIYSILTTGPEAPWNIVWKNAEIIEATFSFSGDWLELERKHIIDNMAGNNLPREEVEGFLLKLILESSQMEHIQKLSLYINDYYRNMNYAVDLIASRKKNDPFITAEATRMNLKLPPQMTQPNISTEEEAPVEINLPKKKKFQLKQLLSRKKDQ